MQRLLKALELNGFKSFAGKVQLDLSYGITAIVGPNGSGKSNIIDAIRWLLGERDARNLRGGKVEDLIFAGSKERPRLGLAQATLYFSNEKKFFPADFAEIAITRQVARDGQSSYFLNKSEVRLKDLVDFLAQSRLGARGLTVITQGNSDAFIRATPTERRGMIEEILGLREFQLKKSDAEKRLVQTEINLEKIKALIEELAPHLRSLKRQTAKWEKREVLEQELKELEDSFFGSRLHLLYKERNRLETILKEKEASRQALLLEQAQAEKKLADIEAGEPKERAQLVVLKKQIEDLNRERSGLERELGKLETLVEQEVVSQKKSPEVRVLTETLHSIQKQLKLGLGGDDLQSLKDLLKKILREIEGVFSEEVDQKPIPKPIHEQLQKIKKDLESLENTLAELKTKEGELEKNQASFYQVFKEALERVGAIKNKVSAWQEANQSFLLEKERVNLRSEELEKQIEQAGRRVSEFKTETTPSLSNETEVERKIFRLRGDLASIGAIDQAVLKEAAETEERYEHLRKESEDLEQSKKDLKGIIKDLREKISKNFEAALHEINGQFVKFFEAMFGGGYGKLSIMKRQKVVESTETDMTPIPEEADKEEGIEIELKLPRKRITSLEMLSGGERSLVGIAALFALISVSPPPFLVLDEVDAALDERNAKRFADLVSQFSERTQFLIVTHNRATMEAAQILYGVTMNSDGTSKVVSLKLES